MKVNRVDFNIHFNLFSIKLNTISIIAISIVMGLFIAKTGNAASFQLSGRVTDNLDVPIANVTINIISPDTNIIVAHTMSDKKGFYDIIVNSGVYFIKAVSPKNSDTKFNIFFKQTLIKDTTVNIIFVPDTYSTSNSYLYNLITNPLYK